MEQRDVKYEIRWCNDIDGIERLVYRDTLEQMFGKYRELKRAIKHGYCKVSIYEVKDGEYELVEKDVIEYDPEMTIK